MLNATIIIGFVVLGLTTGAAALAAGVLYGRLSVLEKMVVEGKRREARTGRELAIWQTKLVERAGFGPLVRRETEQQPAIIQPSRKIESPAQAIMRTKQEDEHGTPAPARPKMAQVPPAVAKNFLNEAASARPPVT